jgi:hypothetical protein
MKRRAVSWDFIERALRLLATHRVDFLVVGEVATQFHASGWCTETLSLWFRPTPDNKERLASAIRELVPRSRGRHRPISLAVSSFQVGIPLFCEVECGSLLLVDALPGLDYHRSFQHADILELTGATIHVISFMDLKTTLALPQDHPCLNVPLDVLRQDRGPPLRIPIEFFPCSMFHDAGDHSSREDWFGKHLRAFGERPLYVLAEQGAEIFRFISMPTFDKPLCIRIENSPAGGRLWSARLSGRGGYEPGIIEETRERPLNSSNWARTRKMLEQSSLWMTRKRDLRKSSLDGTAWILEYARPGLHRGRYGDCPETSTELRQTWEMLMKILEEDLVNMKKFLWNA